MSSVGDIPLESVLLEEASNKRKRDVEDHGDRNQKKVHVEDSRLSIEDLHIDVGNKYLLCRTRKAPFPPDLPFLPRGLYHFSVSFLCLDLSLESFG